MISEVDPSRASHQTLNDKPQRKRKSGVQISSQNLCKYVFTEFLVCVTPSNRREEMPPRRRKGNKETGDAPFQPQEQKPVEIMDGVEDLDDPSSSEEDHSDDPIVKSYDVFISNQLKDHIYLLQYPIRNPDEEYYSQSAPYNARIKPNEGSFDLDVPIDSRNYNFSRGDKFGGSQLDPSIKAESRTLDRQRLSGKCQSNQANYFVGVFLGGAIPR
jgi:hypothetical protein